MDRQILHYAQTVVALTKLLKAGKMLLLDQLQVDDSHRKYMQ